MGNIEGLGKSGIIVEKWKLGVDGWVYNSLRMRKCVCVGGGGLC